jgi:hypothetical protein
MPVDKHGKVQRLQMYRRATEVARGSSKDDGGNVEDILRRLNAVEAASAQARDKTVEISALLPTLATKTEIASLETKIAQTETKLVTLLSDIRHDLMKFVSDTRADAGKLEARIEKGDAHVTRWVVVSARGLLVAIVCAVVAIVKFAAPPTPAPTASTGKLHSPAIFLVEAASAEIS